MVANVKFLIFARGNVEEGPSEDREPFRKIRVKRDASYKDLLTAICTKIKIDPSAHQIRVLHRHPDKSVGDRQVRYNLVAIEDDFDVEDLIEMAEKLGDESIQQLYIEISTGSIGLSDHEKRQVEATIPLTTHQVPRSKRGPVTGDEDSLPKRPRYDVDSSNDVNNTKQEINRAPEHSTTETGENLVVADLRNEDPSQDLMMYKLHDPTAFLMPPSPVLMDITSGIEEGNQTSRPSSSTTPPFGQDYEVFISFRGIDTRYGFTDHLYNGLVDVGVLVFRDNEELRVGKEIGPELLKAINGSKISVPIISKNYASSTWCLNELVQILKCMNTSGQIVLPIFYQVEPYEVRNQKGDFGEGFLQSKEKHDAEGRLVQDWKNALVEVASLKAWESSKIANGHEGKLVKMVVRKVLQVLQKVSLLVSDDLVGVEDHVKKIIEWIAAAKGSSDVHTIVIHGIGGVGKTTLAKVVYNRLYKHFECCSFIANIREASQRFKGIEYLQMQLILQILGRKLDILSIDQGANIIKAICKRKKALIFLDDIDHRDHLNALAGKSDWFGGGTLIIITSRRKDILKKWEGSYSYELNELDQNQSFILFCKHAFKSSESIPDEYKAIAVEIVSTTGGLPLAIEVIGSLLYGNIKDFWEANLKMLKEIPHDEVQRKLKISFDTLNQYEKEIFLDIACFPICTKTELEYAFYMWDSCGFHPLVRIEKLISLSLIKIDDDGGLIMHDQVRDLGREVVRQEDKNKLEKRSRLWKNEEAWEVLESKQGSPSVQALILEPHNYFDHDTNWTSRHFEGMTNLRFLQMDNMNLTGDFENHLLNLRWFRRSCSFAGCPKLDMMGLNFNPKKLVVLELTSIIITEHWEGWSQMKYLKVLELVCCRGLTTTPDFSALELEVLILVNCWDLTRIHPSIGKLRKTLKVLEVSWCPEIEELPIEVWTMEELRTLSLEAISIREIPIVEGYLTKLETLYVKDCRQLTYISDSLGSLVKLQHLCLDQCRSITKIPKSIGKLKLLTNLGLGETSVKELPDSIGELCNLESLCIEHTPTKRLPASIGKLSKLPKLELLSCKELESLPNLPSCLTSLDFIGDSMETLPDFSNLTNLNGLFYMDLFERRNRVLNLGNLNQLKTLRIRDSNYDIVKPRIQLFGDNNFHSGQVSDLKEEIKIPMAPGNFSLQLELPISLVDLSIFGCKTLHILPNLSVLKNLSSLRLSECSELMEIYGLEGAESLTDLEIERCKKLSRLCDFSHLKMLRNLSLCYCEKLRYVEGIEKLMSLAHLSISQCHPNFKFPNLTMLRNLERLTISCEELTEILGLQELKSLKFLGIYRCKPLRYLPDLSQSTNLQYLHVRGCDELTEIRGLENLASLRQLYIRGCTKLRELLHQPEVHVISVPLKEEMDRGILSYASESIHSDDLMEKSSEISLECTAFERLPDQHNVPIVTDPVEEQEDGGYLPDLSQFRNSNDINVKCKREDKNVQEEKGL